MGSWRKAYGRFGAAALVLVMIAACSSAGPTPPLVPGTDHSGLGPGILFPWTGPPASGVMSSCPVRREPRRRSPSRLGLRGHPPRR